MARSIHVDDVPDAVCERLQAQADADGVTLSALIRRELIERAPEQQCFEFGEWLDWLDLVGRDDPISLPPGAVAAALHEGRAERF